MNTNKKYRALLGIVSGLMVTEYVYADKFYGTASAFLEENDNGHKSTPEQVNERQDQYNLNLGGELINSMLELNAEYDAKARTYSEKTQQDRNTVEGKSSLLIGQSSQPADLLLEHSRIMLLKKPDDINVTENEDERDITSVIPTLRARISSVDNIFVKGQFIDVNYVENDFKNSRRDGGTVGFEHRISTTDNMQIFTQQTNIKFPNSPPEMLDPNYTYRSTEFVYSAKLRQLSYNAHIGLNESLPDSGKDYRGPKYAFELGYNSGVQTVAINLRQELTDTSFGGGNKLPNDKQPSGTDSAHDLDRFERKRVDIHWQTHVLCDSCLLIAGAYQIHDRYLNLGQTSRQQGWNVGYNYALSYSSTLSVQRSNGTNKFSDAILGNDYDVKNTRIEYSYKINRSFSVKCDLNNEKREALTGDGSYSESYIGAGMSYDF